MANAFARIEIVKATAGSSAVGLSAYISRSRRQSQESGKTFSFTNQSDDLALSKILLPLGTPKTFYNGAVLWNAAELADTTKDRKTKEVRYKKDAQLAKHMVFALPWEAELSTDQLRVLALGFIQSSFVDHGVAAEIAIHLYDSPFDPTKMENAEVRRKLAHINKHGLEVIRIHEGEPYPEVNGPHVLAIVGSKNKETWRVWQPHAHVLITTRELGPNGFSNKARNLNPGFINTKGGKGFIAEQDHWERQWSDFQEAYFREQGLDLAVDRFSVVPEKHRGKARSADSQTDTKNQALKAQARETMCISENVLAYLTQRRSVFTERDLHRALHKHGIEGAELEDIKSKVLDEAEVLRLYDLTRGDETEFYTTRFVMSQESDLLKQAGRIHARGLDVSDRARVRALNGMTLDDEQKRAFQHCLQDSGLALIQGGAGTGKSYTVNAIRRSYEVDGRRVIGAAPTNTVAADMRRDGFFQADTLHALLYKLDNKRDCWTRNTVVVVDEAAMVDAAIYARLFARIEESGAKLILVGDDRQLASISRGGIYTLLKQKFGATRIDTVRRQDEEWQKQASQDFAHGQIFQGLKAYHAHKYIQWSDTLNGAKAALVRRWAQDTVQRPNENKFVYASTNREVDALNTDLREERVRAEQIEQGEPFNTVRGRINIAVGERIQFHGNDKKIGIYNGTLATVSKIDGHYISAYFGDGRTITFNAKKFNQFGLGYAGTVYRGQGKTHTEVYALYDSPFAWNARTVYVGMTRHKASLNLFVPREHAKTGRELATRMRADDNHNPALAYATSYEDARNMRIDRVRSKLSQRLETARIVATQIIPPKPKVSSSKKTWFTLYPRSKTILQKRDQARKVFSTIINKQTNSGWLTKIWYWASRKVEKARFKKDKSEHQFKCYIENPKRKKRVSKIIQKEREALAKWQQRQNIFEKGNRVFVETNDLLGALKNGQKQGWGCINIHNIESLRRELFAFMPGEPGIMPEVLKLMQKNQNNKSYATVSEDVITDIAITTGTYSPLKP